MEERMKDQIPKLSDETCTEVSKAHGLDVGFHRDRLYKMKSVEGKGYKMLAWQYPLSAEDVATRDALDAACRAALKFHEGDG
jgi:hypothetical protein